MKKIALFLVILSALIANAEISIQEKVTQPRDGCTRRSFSILGGTVNYQFNYQLYTNEKTGALTVGDVSTRSIGLGLNYGWYGNGFLRIVINKKPVMAPATTIAHADDSLLFTWPEATLKLRFPENSDRIFGEVVATSGDPLEITFLANPGFKHKRADYVPWISSGKVHQKLSEGMPVIASPWIMAYDEVENPRGIATLVFDPEKIQNYSFSGTEKSSIITIQFKIKESRFRFSLQGIPGNYLDAETLYENFMKNGNKYLEQLQQFQF
ncbi:MAG: hypothetical protein WCT05_02735 [Lentisphaeria bacterium]